MYSLYDSIRKAWSIGGLLEMIAWNIYQAICNSTFFEAAALLSIEKNFTEKLRLSYFSYTSSREIGLKHKHYW